MDLGIAGKVAFVAGGTGGIGHAVAVALRAEGVRVALAGRRSELAAEQARELGSPDATIGVALDITDPASIVEALAQTRSRLGEIEIVIVNGGGPRPSTASELRPDGLPGPAALLLDGPLGSSPSAYRRCASGPGVASSRSARARSRPPSQGSRPPGCTGRRSRRI